MTTWFLSEKKYNDGVDDDGDVDDGLLLLLLLRCDVTHETTKWPTAIASSQVLPAERLPTQGRVKKRKR
ncbi:hypothetical protein ACLKA7_012779 [Drosophila subpalustris]